MQLSSLLAVLALSAPAFAQWSPADAARIGGTAPDVPASLPDFDVRLEGDQASVRVQGLRRAGRGGALGRAREAAKSRLRARAPDVRIEEDPLLGTPRFVGSTTCLLSAPVEADTPPVDVVRRFVADTEPLFEVDEPELDRARVVRDYPTRHNGVRHLTLQQTVEGIDLFGCQLRANVTADGRLINVASTMLARPAGGWQPAEPRLDALEAYASAMRSIGIEPTIDPTPGTVSKGASAKTIWNPTPDLRDDLPLTTERVYFPRSRHEVVPAYKLCLPEPGMGNTYAILIDATNGTILWRTNLMKHLKSYGGTQDVTFRVFTSDSPAPGTPGASAPDGTQFPVVSRALLTVPPGDVAATSPEHWIPDGGNGTVGNNVDAHLDRDANNVPDLPLTQGSPSRVFDFALDLAQDPTTHGEASVANLFYHCNVAHDRFYELGFDEAAGNFQLDNFGRGGVGGDPVQADSQDGNGLNNACFVTPEDGFPPRMQMFIFNGPDPHRDGSLDAEIVFHEYGHGVTTRLIDPFLLFGEQSGGMGEGWSDFFGLAFNAEATDDPHGTYPFVAWITLDLRENDFDENYYFGIRRFPYSTDIANVNPLTYADTDPEQNAYAPGIPQSSVTSNLPDGVHRVGEVWCMSLLECRANLWDQQGFAGNELMLQLVVDGAKLTPLNPNFIEARDAILQADLVNNGGDNLTELWTGFAKRGLGASASSPGGGSSTTGVVDGFDVPPLIVFQYPAGLPEQLGPGVPTTLQVNVSGLDEVVPSPGTGELYYSVDGGPFQTLAMTELATNEYTVEIPAASCLATVDFYVRVDSSIGFVTNPVSAPAETHAAQVFTGTIVALDDDFESDLGWTVTNDPTLFTGAWERGVPVDQMRGDPPADSDGSGQCYLTQNLFANSDVDGGPTTLTSPVLDLTGGGVIFYDYWLGGSPFKPLPIDDRDGGEEGSKTGAGDGLFVEVATDPLATNWQLLREHTTGQPFWRTESIRIGVEVPATSTVRFRISCADELPNGIVEAGFDAFRVERFECAAPVPTFCDASDMALASCPCSNPGNPGSGCDLAQGTGGVELTVVAQQTSPSNRVTLQGAGYPAMAAPASIVIRSTGLDPSSPVVFGDGLRCVGVPIVRLGATFASAGVSSHAFGHGTMAGAGEFDYQLWFRNTPISFCDPAAAFNLSNGVAVSW